jgi:MFS family permease
VLGAVAIGLAFVLLSLQHDIDHFHLLHLIIGFFGCASLYTPLITTVGLWFERRRGLSLGIVTAGGTVGQGITPLVVQPLIDRLGWQGAYLTLGIVFLCLIAPLMTFVEKPSPGHVAVVANDTSSWSLDPRLSVGWLSLAAFLCCVTMASALVHLVPFMIECGRSPIMAGSLFMTVMLAGAVGRLLFGLLADCTGALVAYMLASLMQTTMLYWFVVFDSLTPLFFVGATFGFGYAGVMTTVNLSVREAVPARSAGFSTAIVSVFAWAGMGAGGGLTGYFFDATGSYVMPFAGAVLVGVANLIVLSLLLIVLSVRNRGCAVDSGASA